MNLRTDQDVLTELCLMCNHRRGDHRVRVGYDFCGCFHCYCNEFVGTVELFG